jgi:hypothetical protein
MKLIVEILAVLGGLLGGLIGYLLPILAANHPSFAWLSKTPSSLVPRAGGAVAIIGGYFAVETLVHRMFGVPELDFNIFEKPFVALLVIITVAFAVHLDILLESNKASAFLRRVEQVTAKINVLTGGDSRAVETPPVAPPPAPSTQANSASLSDQCVEKVRAETGGVYDHISIPANDPFPALPLRPRLLNYLKALLVRVSVVGGLLTVAVITSILILLPDGTDFIRVSSTSRALSIIIPLALTIPLSRVLLTRTRLRILSWAIVGAMQATATALICVRSSHNIQWGFPYWQYLGVENRTWAIWTTWVLFGLSGGIAGILASGLRPKESARPGTLLGGTSVGVLFHYCLAGHYWNTPYFTPSGILLLPLEFFSPALFAYSLVRLRRRATELLRRESPVVRAATLAKAVIGPFARPLFLGGLAGLLTSAGYLGFILLLAYEYQRGYFIDLGGSARILNGLWQVTLPSYLTTVNVIMSFFWGLLFARALDSNRPAWWKVAPLMWIAFALWLAFIWALLKIANLPKGSDVVLAPMLYGVFGALLGCVMRSLKAATILAAGCVATYVSAVGLASVIPIFYIVDFLFPSQETASYAVSHTTSYALSYTALREMLNNTFWGCLTGVLIFTIGRRGP